MHLTVGIASKFCEPDGSVSTPQALPATGFVVVLLELAETSLLADVLLELTEDSLLTGVLLDNELDTDDGASSDPPEPPPQAVASNAANSTLNVEYRIQVPFYCFI